jgi:trk system potassium uptake protein TrkH
MLPAFLIAAFARENTSLLAFAFTIVLCMTIGTFLVTKKDKRNELYSRESFIIVALAWITMSIFGALPFIVSGEIPNIMDALFETVSGFTTTGATILRDVEILSTSILYWRSFTHWIGGMGILVFMLAVVPLQQSGVGAFHLLRAESPGPISGKLVPRLRKTAIILYTIYISLTIAEILLLMAGGMPLFDSVTHAFGTAGTGGFSIKNQSLAAYDSA